MTRKSAKYSWIARTTSWSSASASRSSDDFLMMLLKSSTNQLPHQEFVPSTRTYVVFAIFGVPELLD